MDTQLIKQHIEFALKEDVQQGDFSTLACVDNKTTNKVKLIAKQEGVLCGMEVFAFVFELLDTTHSIKIDAYKKDGDSLKVGDVILRMQGNAQTILTGERTALNYMQLLSGIATTTKEYVSLIADTHAKLLDTRKTTPTLRMLEKYAVKVGGGYNHRFGLFDMIMLKDNHIDFAGGIKKAINKTNEYLQNNNLNLKIEIEVRNFEELEEVLQCGRVDRIMLDNFSVEDLKKAIEIINNKYETEASGGINKNTIRAYAQTGVDYISVGALTHHISALDISLVADE